MMPWTTLFQEISLEYIHLLLYLMLFTKMWKEEPLCTKCVSKGERLVLKIKPLSMIFYKTLLPAKRRLIVFAYFFCLLICQLNANFKEHCKWAKK